MTHSEDHQAFLNELWEGANPDDQPEPKSTLIPAGARDLLYKRLKELCRRQEDDRRKRHT